MDQKRGLFRLSIKRTGRLIQGTDVATCEVLDLTDKGMLIHAARTVSIGDELQLEFPLTPTTLLQCTIHVTHVAPPHLGARIASISSEHQQSLSRFIDELLTLNMTGF
ncbi:MAG: PilZ domain-containing protein [Nitrospirota bacterium]|nr:PilZ domain-containing protein [Nitrospirota bacterium]